MMAMPLVASFPHQIEADLQSVYGRRIAEWHRGDMSSRELLALLENLPERSSYKGAVRGAAFGVDYEWSAEEYREAALARQLAPIDGENGDMQVSQMLYESYFSPVERAVIEMKQATDAHRAEKARRYIFKGLLGEE
jgi:hypothetical protein